MKQDKENQKFWSNWLTQEKSLVVGKAPITDKEVKGQVAEKLGLHKRSITPTTLDQVILNDLEDDFLYKEIYQYKGNAITRFGINLHSETFFKKLQEELLNYNKELKFKLDQAEEKISNISGVTNYQNFAPKYIEITGIEKTILDSAKDYIFNQGQKLVLIDILPRETSKDKKTGEPAGRINLESLDTHTVLLYRTVEDKLLVIDPNNPMFSAHLNKYPNITTLCSTATEHKIYSRPTKSETGFSPEKFRDCIDIAVKLGLFLNKDGNEYKEIEEVMTSDAVKFITNNPLLQNFKFSLDNLIRLKQSSDIDQVVLCNKKMHQISNKIVQEDSRYEEAQKKLEDEHFSILHELSQDKNYLMEELQKEYTSNILGNIQEEEI